MCPSRGEKTVSNQDDFNDAIRKVVREFVGRFDAQVDANLDEALKPLDDLTKQRIKSAFGVTRDKQRRGG
jgi:hypothetical protein